MELSQNGEISLIDEREKNTAMNIIDDYVLDQDEAVIDLSERFNEASIPLLLTFSESEILIKHFKSAIKEGGAWPSQILTEAKRMLKDIGIDS